MVELDEDDGREDDQRRRDGQADVGQRQELLELVGATLHRRQRRLRRPGSEERHRVGLVSRTKLLLVDNFIEVLVDDDPRCQVSAKRNKHLELLTETTKVICSENAKPIFKRGDFNSRRKKNEKSGFSNFSDWPS